MSIAENVIGAGEFLFHTTSVIVKGFGILALQVSQVSTLQEYEKISERDFILKNDHTYTFKQLSDGSYTCDRFYPNKFRSKDTLIVSKGDTYKIIDINFIGQIDDDYSNNLAEIVTIQNGLNKNTISITLDENDLGLSIRERIDLLELCN